MPVPANITLLSTTAASNSPPGTESPASTDDYLRAQAAFIAQLRAVIGGATDANIPNSAVQGAKQATALDTTAGALMVVGAFGLGASNLEDTAADLNSINITGFYLVTGANQPAGILAGYLIVTANGATNIAQRYIAQNTPREFIRVLSAYSWSAWVEVATSTNSFGQGQTWQDVTGSRALGVTYTNSTGRPIMVAVSSFSSASSFMVLTVAGQIIPSTLSPSCPSSTAIIPDGATYRAYLSSGTASTLNWKELR